MVINMRSREMHETKDGFLKVTKISYQRRSEATECKYKRDNLTQEQ